MDTFIVYIPLLLCHNNGYSNIDKVCISGHTRLFGHPGDSQHLHWLSMDHEDNDGVGNDAHRDSANGW
jgi:hypothetical protein